MPALTQLTEEARTTRHYASPLPGEPGFQDLPVSALLAPPPAPAGLSGAGAGDGGRDAAAPDCGRRGAAPEPGPDPDLAGGDACVEGRAAAGYAAWEVMGPGRLLAISRLGLGWGMTPLAGGSLHGIQGGGPLGDPDAPTACMPAPLAAAAWASSALAGGRKSRMPVTSSSPGPDSGLPSCFGAAGARKVAPAPQAAASRAAPLHAEAMAPDMGRHAAAAQRGRGLGGASSAAGDAPYAALRRLGPVSVPAKLVGLAAGSPETGLGAKVACCRMEPCFQVAARCGGGHIAADPGGEPGARPSAACGAPPAAACDAAPAAAAPSMPAQTWRTGVAHRELAAVDKELERSPAPGKMGDASNAALLCLERLSSSSAEEAGAERCHNPNPGPGGDARAGDTLLSMERLRAPGARAAPPAHPLPGIPELQGVPEMRGPDSWAAPAPAGSPLAREGAPLRSSAATLLSPASGMAAATLRAVRLQLLCTSPVLCTEAGPTAGTDQLNFIHQACTRHASAWQCYLSSACCACPVHGRGSGQQWRCAPGPSRKKHP